MNWRRLLCLFYHLWSAPINLCSVSIQRGKVILRRAVDIEENNIMISLLVCARCEHTKFKHETNLPVVKIA